MLHAALCHRYGMIRSRDVIDHMTIRRHEQSAVCTCLTLLQPNKRNILEVDECKVEDKKAELPQR